MIYSTTLFTMACILAAREFYIDYKLRQRKRNYTPSAGLKEAIEATERMRKGMGIDP